MRLVLLGGGHAHAVVLRARRGAHITLVSPYPLHTYSGMLPGVIARHYRREDCEIDLARLARAADAEFVLDEVRGLDAAARTVRTASGRVLTYDIASLNVGSLSGAPPHALGVKPFGPFLDRLGAVMQQGDARIAVVGGGAGGVELAMAIRYQSSGRVALYSDRLQFSVHVARRVRAALQRIGVELVEGGLVTDVEGFDTTVWAAGPAAHPWLRESGLALDERGFVLVDATLRSISHPEVFAAGDCATLSDTPHPKSGVFSVRHGPLLAANLAGGTIRYTPQARQLSLISCGSRYAIADWNGWSAEGAWAWRWKDRIDRRWIAGFRT